MLAYPTAEGSVAASHYQQTIANLRPLASQRYGVTAWQTPQVCNEGMRVLAMRWATSTLIIS